MATTTVRRTRRGAVATAIAATLALAALALPWAGTVSALSVPGALPVGISSLVASTATGAAGIRGIATFDVVPTAAQVAGLEGLGLVVQPMQHVPLALVAGPVASMQAAVLNGVATDVYPDEPIQLLDTASSDAMGAAALRAAGLTGRGRDRRRR